MEKNEVEKFEEKELREKIYSIRGFQVMLDKDLAELYGVQTKILNKAVKRNIARFPENFCFQLKAVEIESLRFHFGTIENEGTFNTEVLTVEDRRGRHSKYLPYAFTEQGVAMLAGILSSATAVRVSIHIMNAFVAMRKFMQTNAQMFQRLDRVELIIIDDKIIYHFGASLKDLGKKWFGFSRMDIEAVQMLSKLGK